MRDRARGEATRLFTPSRCHLHFPRALSEGPWFSVSRRQHRVESPVWEEEGYRRPDAFDLGLLGSQDLAFSEGQARPLRTSRPREQKTVLRAQGPV